MKVAFILLLAGSIDKSMTSPTTTKSPIVNYDSTDETTTEDPPMVNFENGDGDGVNGYVIVLPEDEDKEATAEAAMMETEAAMYNHEYNDNSTIENEKSFIPILPNRNLPFLVKIFPTFGRGQFM